MVFESYAEKGTEITFTISARKEVSDIGLSQSEEQWERFRIAKITEKRGDQDVKSNVPGAQLPRGFMSPVVSSRAPKIEMALSPR